MDTYNRNKLCGEVNIETSSKQEKFEGPGFFFSRHKDAKLSNELDQLCNRDPS